MVLVLQILMYRTHLHKCVDKENNRCIEYKNVHGLQTVAYMIRSSGQDVVELHGTGQINFAEDFAANSQTMIFTII